MKIAFVCSDRYSEYEELTRNLIDNIIKKIPKDEKSIEACKITLSTRKKYDLYIFIVDDVEEFKLIYSKLKPKNKPLLITKNLAESYIKETINYVIDIVYSKSNINIVANRIISVMEKIYA